ncbi:MAG: Reeler domain-containing protein [Verrucomicrobiales bacterium]
MNRPKNLLALTAISALVSCILFSTSAAGRSSTPPSNRTGAPGHSTCATCHSSTGTGTVELGFSGGSDYTPGELYTMLVTISDPDKMRFGFSMSARDSDNNSVDVGTWTAVGADTQVHGAGGSLAGHRNAPNFLDGEKVYEVSWTAPEVAVGDVTFYVAAVAANGDLSNGQGDNTYLNTLTISEPVVVPNMPPSLSVPGTPLNTTTGIGAAIGGISVSDPDAGDGILSVTLSVEHGTLDVDESVPGGADPMDFLGNGTDRVTLKGTLDELNATFGDPNGVTYESNAGYVGEDSLEISVNDNGNTGSGGEMIGTASVAILVNPPPFLSELQVVNGVGFQLTLNGVAERTYLVEYSANLSDWFLVERITLDSASTIVLDETALDVPARFYRAREVVPQ